VRLRVIGTGWKYYAGLDEVLNSLAPEGRGSVPVQQASKRLKRHSACFVRAGYSDAPRCSLIPCPPSQEVCVGTNIRLESAYTENLENRAATIKRYHTMLGTLEQGSSSTCISYKEGAAVPGLR
jgi:hypothetical protein